MKAGALIFLTLCGTLLFGCATQRTGGKDYRAGAAKAQQDIGNGNLVRLDPYGIIRTGTLDMRNLLKEKYGISYKLDRRVSSAFARAYNEAMSAEARRKFGDDYYEDALLELELDTI